MADRRFQYQRIIAGYHGCDASLVDHVLRNHNHLYPSENEYDWLGEGIYFWEYAPRRALEFAREKAERDADSEDPTIENPAVVGAYINLGTCFDLTDTEHTRLLAQFYPGWRKGVLDREDELPANKSPDGDESGKLLRFLDCAVINAYMDALDTETDDDYYYETVRGVFEEGESAFDGSCIRTKSHVQVAVRDPSCIVGYFLPVDLFAKGDDDG